ncbi:nucleotidyltransferase/DNA polymerase involved in DNA repair [Bradyrhizobium sp. USDA 4473]
MPATSYEARKFGVGAAMPSVTAKRQCPDLIFVNARFEVYKAESQQMQVREIFAEHTPIIEPLSLDEAYLDVTGICNGWLACLQKRLDLEYANFYQNMRDSGRRSIVMRVQRLCTVWIPTAPVGASRSTELCATCKYCLFHWTARDAPPPDAGAS